MRKDEAKREDQAKHLGDGVSADQTEADAARVEWLNEQIAESLPWLSGVARRLLKNRDDGADAAMEACLRCLRAVESGLEIRSVPGFLRHAVRQAAVTLSRDRRRRAGREVDNSILELIGEKAKRPECAADAAAPVDQRLLAEVRESLPASWRPWLDDLLSGRNATECAERDGVDEAAIRKRRSRLASLVQSEDFLRHILEFSSHTRRPLAPTLPAPLLESDERSVAPPGTKSSEPIPEPLETKRDPDSSPA